jgi:hypothetical protein
MATENGLHKTLVLWTMGIIANKVDESLKLFNLHPAVYILMHNALILKKTCIVIKFLAE